jgi:hypothetical protein
MKRFRFSLLSLLVGAVLAGGVVYLNVRPGTPLHSEVPVIPIGEVKTFSPKYILESRVFGWPFRASSKWIGQKASRHAGPDSIEGREWQWPGLAANIAIGLAIVIGGAGVCEHVVRRRGKKTER